MIAEMLGNEAPEAQDMFASVELDSLSETLNMLDHPEDPLELDHQVSGEDDSRYLSDAVSGYTASRYTSGTTDSQDLAIVFAAYQGSRNVEGRGRMFRVDDGSGNTYHSMQVVSAFLAYKLDPELQRRMPGLDLHFRPDDGTTAYDVVNHYRCKNEGDGEEENIEVEGFAYGG